MARLSASVRASLWVSGEEWGEGITAQTTRSEPSASAATHAVSAESIPPESPSNTRSKPFLST